MRNGGPVASPLSLRISGITTLLVSTVLVFLPAICLAQSGLELKILETVGYKADRTGSGPDRPSIAVRNDGLIRVAIGDQTSACCPVVQLLKVATRDVNGNWVYIKIADYSDQLTAGFLPDGNLGVTFLDYSGASFQTMLARVGDSGATFEVVPTPIPGNPGSYLRMLPWVADSVGKLQVVSSIAPVRLRRTGTLPWKSVAVPSLPQDIVAATQGGIFILTVDGVYTYKTNLLSEQGILKKVVVNQGGNLAVDGFGRMHLASLRKDGSIRYKLLEKNHAHPLETVALPTARIINHQSLVVDSAGRPYLIYSNLNGRMVVARRGDSGWIEDIDLGLGQSGSMVLGPTGSDLHAAFAGIDGVIRYAKIEITGAAAPAPLR